MINPPLWKASVVVAKASAGDIAAAFELGTSPQAVLIHEEPFEPMRWSRRCIRTCRMAICSPSSRGARCMSRCCRITDWIKLSQEGLPPVRAGRFFVYGAHDAGTVPPGVIPIRIEAGMAFGTGHHETTALCLGALSDLAKRRRYANVLDLGCGTGLARHRRGEAVAQARARLRHRSRRRRESRAKTRRRMARRRWSTRSPPTASPIRQLAAKRALRSDRRQHPGRTADASSRRPSRARWRTAASLILSGLLTWQENLVLVFLSPAWPDLARHPARRAVDGAGA